MYVTQGLSIGGGSKGGGGEAKYDGCATAVLTGAGVCMGVGDATVVEVDTFVVVLVVLASLTTFFFCRIHCGMY